MLAALGLIQRPEQLMENHAWPAAGAGVDIALGIDAQELGSSPGGGFFVGNKCLHPASLEIADANTPFPAGIPARVRHAIGYVNMALIVDSDRARLSELCPSRDEVSVLVQNLNALIAPVGDVHVACGRIQRDVVKALELEGKTAFRANPAAPLLDEFAIR